MSVSARGCVSTEVSRGCDGSLGVPRRCALVMFVGVRDLSLFMSSQLCAVSSLSFRCISKSESDGFFPTRGFESI